MRWTNQQYADYQARNKAPSPKPEQVVRDEPLAAVKGEAPNTGRIPVRITSFRRRLLDPDNLCAKYFLDCARYSGLIPDDRQEDIALTVEQVKVKTKEEERTEIEIL